MEVRDSQHLSAPSYSRLISPRESFGLQKNSSQSQSPAMQNMRLEFSSDGTPVYKPLSSQYTGGGAVGTGNGAAAPTFVQQGIGMNMEEPMKRKRGRPRKYEPDGKIAFPVTTVSPTSAAVAHLGGSGFSSPTQSQSSMKKARGRPPGSGKKHQMAALGAAGVGFTPHVITVKAGEDVSSKIISFSQHGARNICIMSANGAISNVTLRQAATTGGTVTYEGRFEILSLSGSFFISEVDGQRSRTGGLSVSLAGSDGRVLGGGVAGLLTAASPVQIVVGSFVANGNRESTPINPSDPLSAPPKLATGGATGTHSPPSQGTPSESSGGSDSPRNQSVGIYGNNTPQSYGSMPWK